MGFDSSFIAESLLYGWFGVSGWLFGGLLLFIKSSAIGKICLVIGLITNWLYFTVLESSKLQSTLGKYILGVRVKDLNYQPISFKQSNIRYWSKLISMLLFMLIVGIIRLMLNNKEQIVHDELAKTIVVYKQKKIRFSN